MNELTPIQALAVLINATEPLNIARLSRANFVEIERALIVLNDFVNSHYSPDSGLSEVGAVEKLEKPKKSKSS